MALRTRLWRPHLRLFQRILVCTLTVFSVRAACACSFYVILLLFPLLAHGTDALAMDTLQMHIQVDAGTGGISFVQNTTIICVAVVTSVPTLCNFSACARTSALIYSNTEFLLLFGVQWTQGGFAETFHMPGYRGV